MKDNTLKAIETMALADGETTPEQLKAILNACRKPNPKRKLILAKEAMQILQITRPTLRKICKEGLLTVVRPTPRKTRFYLEEVEKLLYPGD